MRKFVIGFGLMSVLAACSDPLADVPKFADVELQDTSVQVDAVAVPVDASDTRPLFQRLLGKKEAPVVEAPAVETPAESATETTAETTTRTSDAPATQDEAIAAAVAEAAPVSAPAPTEDPKSKLFGFLKPKAQKEPALAELADPEKIAPAKEATIVQASLQAEPEANPSVTAEKERSAFKGLFGKRKAAALTGPDAALVEPGIALPFGVIARVCKLKKSEMGREVERSSDGKGKFRLYDSAPGNTAMHTYYITGFDDGCPRQVTAALAMFGDVARHEFLRYGEHSKGQSWSETDTSYEKIKRKVCKVGKGKPCGSNLAKLEKSTSFLTVYSAFVGAPTWRNILLHDGSVVAMN